METKEVVVELGRGEAAPPPRRVVAPRVELGFGGFIVADYRGCRCGSGEAVRRGDGDAA